MSILPASRPASKLLICNCLNICKIMMTWLLVSSRKVPAALVKGYSMIQTVYLGSYKTL